MNCKRCSGKGILLILALVILLVNSSSVLAGLNLNADYPLANDNDLSITLTWKAQTAMDPFCQDNFSYFRLMRDDDSVIVYEGVGNTSTDETHDPDNYTYSVSAYHVEEGSLVVCDQDSDGPHNLIDREDPKNITYIDAMDYPSDDGTAIIINWGHSPDYFEDDDNYLLFYRIQAFADGDCSGTQVGTDITRYRSQCVTPTYTWEGLTPGEEYCFKFIIEDVSGNTMGGGNDVSNATDNLGPAPPQNPEAEDVEDDQGEDGIALTWEASPDQGSGSQDVSTYKYYSRYKSIGDYIYFGNTTLILPDELNKTYWEYSSEDFGGVFDSRVVAEYLGLYVPPFNDDTFYFYITAYDGTFETQSIIVNERFNAEPTIEDIRLFPNAHTARTTDDLSCVAFICELNEDDTITGEAEFGVTHFYNATGGEIVNKNSSCTNLGKLSNGVIPQYPYINVDCYNDHGESGNVWECISNLENEYTFMADKVTCEMTVADEMEEGEIKTYGEFHGIYPINNTAPTASDVEIAPSNPLGDDTLTCEFEFNDVDGNSESVKGTPYALEHDTYTNYKWYINNEGLNDYILLPGKTSVTLDEYYDQNDYVKCGVNPCDKELSWLDNPLCQGETVEGSQGKEYWILEGDVCAGYMECGLMDETQCTYANESNQNWGCTWDDDNIESTPAALYGSKALAQVDIAGSAYYNLSYPDAELVIQVNGNRCVVDLVNNSEHGAASTILAPSWEVMRCINNGVNTECGWTDDNCTGLVAINRAGLTEHYPSDIITTKLYTTQQNSDASLVILSGTDESVLESIGFEVGQQDTGSDAQGWCTGEINTQCRNLDVTGCSNTNVSLSDGGFCYDPGNILTFTNSTPTIIGGNSIPQIISYQDDSTESEPTNVGSFMTFNSTWVDTDPNELGRLIVCPMAGGTEDYGCDGDSCNDSITFGDNGNTAWAYTNETSMMIETVEIKARDTTISGVYHNTTGYATPFIFSIIAFEADNSTMGNNPLSSLEGYYEDSTIIIARSDWNPLTVGEWSTFTLQYNAQPLEGKYTGLKFCIANPNEPGITGGGATGYSISGSDYQKVYTGDNWFGRIIFTLGKFFRGIFSFTGRATTSYNDNCLTANEFLEAYPNSSITIAANSSSSNETLIYDNTDSTGVSNWYNKADIRINYLSSTGTGGSCPGPKTYCETDLSLDRDIGCTYEAEDEDETISEYHMRVCDDENSCSIWRPGYFYANHLPYLDWVTIGTDHLSYEEGLTYTSDVNNDWNLQCIRSIAHDTDLLASQTSQIIIDADGWTTVFQNQLEKDSNLVNGTTLKTCNNTGLYYVDVNGAENYDYKIDTLAFNNSVTEYILLHYSNETTGIFAYFNESDSCYYHDTNNNNGYDNGEDIIWDTYSSGITTIYNETLLYEYEWFVKPYGSNEFDSCSDFLWCDNNGNDILAHGNTEPGDEWLCEVTPIDWRGVGQGKNSSILHVTAGTGGTSPGQGGPEITYVTHNYDQDNPAIVGQDATISVGWGGEYDYVKLYLCDGNSPYIRNSGCWGYEFNRTTTSVSPINAVFELEEGAYVYNVEDHGPVNYTVILCSDEYDCSNSSDYFYINHLPEIDDLELLYYDGSGYSSGSSTNETQALQSQHRSNQWRKTMVTASVSYQDKSRGDKIAATSFYVPFRIVSHRQK